jgi:biuret amidohydrolase
MATIEELVQRDKVAIMVHEMQRAVVGDLVRPGWPSADAVKKAGIVEPLAGLLDSARARSIRVVHCAATFRADKVGSFANAPVLERALQETGYMIEGTPDVDPMPELYDRARDVVIPRYHGMSSFAGTELDWVLRSLGATTVIITGVSINRGVTGSTIEAVNYGYRVVIPRDCVAGFPPEYGDLMLEHTLAPIAWLTTSAEILASWEAAGAVG